MDKPMECPPLVEAILAIVLITAAIALIALTAMLITTIIDTVKGWKRDAIKDQNTRLENKNLDLRNKKTEAEIAALTTRQNLDSQLHESLPEPLRRRK